MGRVGGKVRTLAALLSKWGSNAHAYLPGISTISGLPTENFTSSTGDTGYSAVDGVVGLALDAVGTVGAELIGPSAVWTTGGGLTVSGGVITGTGGTGALRLQPHGAAIVIGKRYLATMTISARSAGDISLPYDGTNVQLKNAVGSYTFQFVATTPDVYIYNVGFVGTVSVASLKEITGIAATQPTTANKPKLERGARNLLLNSVWAGGTSGALGSGGLPPTNWTASANTGSLTFAGGSIRFVAAAQRPFITHVPTVAVGTYVASVKVESVTAGTTVGDVINLGTGTATATTSFKKNNVVCLSSDAYAAGDTLALVVVVTVAGTIVPRFGLGSAGASTGDVTLSSPQLETGSTASAYSPTTTAAASNPLAGAYSWSFDGSNDSLTLGSVPFQMSDDHCVIAVIKPSALGATMYPANFGVGAGSQMVCALQVNSLGGVGVAWRDDAALFVNIASTNTYPLAATVVSGVKIGNSKRLRVNGVQDKATETTVMGATTSTSGIFGDWKSGGGNLFSGSLGPVIVIKGTVTDAELLALERLVGQLAGVTI